MTKAPTALIINFTGLSGHWGMFGTSLALVSGLGELGYVCSAVTVETVRDIQRTASWQKPDQFSEALEAGEHNAIGCQIASADIVVVNGEGTLHGWRRSALNLLGLIRYASERFQKPVHLINFGCFPGPESTGDILGPYAEAFESLSRNGGTIVARDSATAALIRKLGQDCLQGFDLSPLIIKALQLRDPMGTARVTEPYYVVSGGAESGLTYHDTLDMLDRVASAGQRLVYLSGGFPSFVKADREFFRRLRRARPPMEWKRVSTYGQFLGELAGTKLLVSSRFHYLISAVALGTPICIGASNTDKNEILARDFADAGALKTRPMAVEGSGVSQAPAFVPDALRSEAVIEAARLNFANIPRVGPPRSCGLFRRMAARLGTAELAGRILTA